jgi:NADPH:quinone reductase-like Zn-dependent oxidoreductase
MNLCCAARSKPRWVVCLEKVKPDEFKPTYREVDLPGPVYSEVSVIVKAASISQIDLDMGYNSKTQSYKKRKDGLILGCDFSGEVKDVGDKVHRFKKGDLVYGCVNFAHLDGTWAQTILIKEEFLQKIPDKPPVTLSFLEAATIPYSLLTAYRILTDKDKFDLKKDDNILIHDASVDEGYFAIQLASLYGAQVYASTTQMDKADELRQLGATEVGEYWKDCSGISFKYAVDFSYGDKPSEAIATKVKQSAETKLFLVSDNQKYASLREDSKNKIAYFALMESSPDDWAKLASLVEKGEIKTSIREKVNFTMKEQPQIGTQPKTGLGKQVFVIDDKLIKGDSWF